ncbi:hypothetical protein GGTG_12139 [Gaeumannomyces tritici R3-111a-1]|uniref:Uncharacterized protein n=1 Tax=Gaeumannomyces tritici (strain R3-111a-1) TaxID=644352 RepID=J3PF60_GAET3|nr:hypothetical protein GGTG_12139 [Gaeumannomyces tritici R3-111a-1]EJT69962.1 hypothetical protein GGTG_12139 [Gaeumannomyces tritici R3-111a-1]
MTSVIGAFTITDAINNKLLSQCTPRPATPHVRPPFPHTNSLKKDLKLHIIYVFFTAKYI